MEETKINDCNDPLSKPSLEIPMKNYQPPKLYLLNSCNIESGSLSAAENSNGLLSAGGS